MAYTLDNPEETHATKFDLFEPLPVETGILSREWREYRPVSQITPGASIEFNISNGVDYIDLMESRLYIKAKILKNDGLPYTAEDDVAVPVNFTLSSLFRQIDVSLQQQLITSSVGGNAPYKAAFDILLFGEKDPDDLFLQSQLFYKDTAGAMESVDYTEGVNKGLTARYAYTRRGREFELQGPLYVDVCQMNRYILNGVSINIKLHPSSDNFRLMAKESKFHIEITDAMMKVCHIQPSPGVVMGHTEALEVGPTLYNYTQSDIKTYTIPSGSFQFSTENLFQSNIPSQVIVAMVDSAACAGNITLNGFNFQHFHCNFADFKVNGQSTPTQPFQPNFDADQYITPFLSLSSGKKKRNIITRDDYQSGYTIFKWNIEGRPEEDFTTLRRQGQTRLTLKFSSSLKKPVTVIVYGRFPSIMRIDKARTVMI